MDNNGVCQARAWTRHGAAISRQWNGTGEPQAELAISLRLWEKNRAKGIDPKSLNKIKRILSALNAATKPLDLNLPGFRFHELKGDQKGDYAVTVRASFRIVFAWEGGKAVRVDEEDYHGD